MLSKSTCFLVVMILLIPGTGFAQSWLEGREDREGRGVKLGDTLVLHVGLGAEGGYDSNATYTHDPVSAGRLRITPYLDVTTRSTNEQNEKENAVQLTPPKAIFRFGLAVSYDRYFSKNKAAVDSFNGRFNPFGFDSHLNFTLFPERKVSVLGGVTYIKTLEPYETSEDAQSKHNVVPMFALRFMPGGGTLTIEPKYRLNLLHFSDDLIGIDSNRYAHEVMLSTNWKIFPKTALISTVLFTPTVYYGDNSMNIDSYPLRSWFGMQGLVFDKFGFRALIGYGAGFYETGSSFEGLIADLAVMFYFNHFSKVTVGAKRDFVDSFYGNYYLSTGGYFSYEHMFGGRFLLTIATDISKRKYVNYIGDMVIEGFTVVANTEDREDIWINGSLSGELRATDWLSFHASLKFWKDITDFSYVTTDTRDGLPTVVYADFSKVELFGGVRVHY